MIKCFLVPMTEPPYSRENPQRPQYMDELRINWTGSPLMVKRHYLIMANSTPEKLLELQNKKGVIDMPNIDDDKLVSLPKARKDKNKIIETLIGKTFDQEKSVKDLINEVANSEGNTWDKDKLFVPE